MTQKKLKDWFDKELATSLSEKILIHDLRFNKKKFVSKIDQGVKPLELKDRVEFIADSLHNHLGENYSEVMQTLMKIIGPENEEETGMFSNFYWVMPIAKYIEKYGLNDFELSMKAIVEVTKRNTSEYAIRPFIETYPDKTLTKLLEWSTDKNLHVRRLSCEGVRPRLPWASKLDQFILDPNPIIPILENLKDDPSKYVQKSVANCINDITKDNLTVAKALVEKWNRKDATKQRKWIIKHALRKMIKSKDSWALNVIKA